MLDSYLMYLESLDVQVDRVDDEIAWRVSVGGDVRFLMSLTGFSVYGVLLSKSEFGTVERFADYKTLVSWAGLAPLLH